MKTVTDIFHPVHQCNDGLFNTCTGLKVNLHKPEPGMITIEDIANSLSKICRFGGHTSCFYSVAQHSVLVAHMTGKDYFREALLHDAAEAYLGDVIKPLKVMLGEVYAQLESSFESAIAIKYNLDTADSAKQMVKRYDLSALEMEHEAFQKGNPASFLRTLVKYNLMVEDTYAWSHETAKRVFLETFRSI